MMNFLLLLGSTIDTSPLPDPKDNFVPTLLSIAIKIMAAVCLLFITIGGFRYITSQGDPQGVAKAKGTIIYALIGLVVIIIAQAVVVFVVKGIK